MLFWKQFPFIRLTITLIIGIFGGFTCDSIPDPPSFLIIATAGIVFFVFFFSKRISYRFRWLSGCFIYILLTLLAFRITRQQNDIHSPSHFANFNTEGLCIADIVEPVVQKERSTKIILKVIAVKSGGQWKKTFGNGLVYLQKDSLSQSLFYGDRLLLRNKFTEPGQALNPGGFDTRKYLKYKGISRQAYLKQGYWKVIGKNTGNPVISMALSWRNTLLDIFRKNGLRGKEFAVAAALLLGYVDEIDADLMHDYSVTGAMHILSVSGMHVGVIFLFLEKVLGFLNKKRRDILLKAILCIVLIWIYSLITGLSPAVLRAATMISLVIIGNSLRRNPNIFNILGVSFFFLLIWEPNLLFDLGFQLSYIAVAGIVILYKPVYDLFLTENWLLEKVWSILAVSVAAQLSTLPVCLYFFHQFPNLFMITNLIVVPLSNLVIYLGIFCLALGSIPIVSYLISKIFYFSVWSLNAGIHFIGSLPYAVTQGIFITQPDMILLYFVILFAVLFAFEKKKKWCFLALFILLNFNASLLFQKVKAIENARMVVYQTKNSFLIDCAGRGESFLAGNLRALDDAFFLQGMNKFHSSIRVKEKFRMVMVPDVVNSNRLLVKDRYLKEQHFIGYWDKRVGMISRKLPSGFSGSVKLDFLVISSNPKVTIRDLLRNFKTRVVVLDASNSMTSCKRWKEEAAGLGLKCHSIRESGAFILDF